jgi:hypothetical protein
MKFRPQLRVRHSFTGLPGGHASLVAARRQLAPAVPAVLAALAPVAVAGAVMLAVAEQQQQRQGLPMSAACTALPRMHH